MEQLIEDVKIITLFSLAIFSIFLVTYKRGNRKVNITLGLIYGYQALESLNSAFYRFFDFWSVEFPWVFYSTEFTFFLWGPTILYFFRLSINTEVKFDKRDVWHLLPSIIHTLFLFYKFHFHSNADKIIMLENGVMTVVEDFVIHFLRNASVVVYLVWSAIEFKKYKNTIGTKKTWLMFFLIVFIVVELIQIFHFIDLETRTYNQLIYNITTVLWFTVAITTLFKALQDPYFLVEVQKKTRDKSLVEKEEFKDILSKIQQYAIKEEKYLNPDLNLSILSKEIGVPSKKVSFVINENYEQSFSDFINSLRVERAKILLREADISKNVIEIAYEVGFNSKATFNRVFAKFAAVSPTEFRSEFSE